MPLPNTASNTPCSLTKSVFSDAGMSSPLANPVTADANGYATFYLDSLGYSYSVYDSGGAFQFTGYSGSALGAIQYGVGVNTIAQGNDSRIVNASKHLVFKARQLTARPTTQRRSIRPVARGKSYT